jgi:hypothetical protein
MALTARELIDRIKAMTEAERRELATLMRELPVDFLVASEALHVTAPYRPPPEIQREVLHNVIRTSDLTRRHDLPH